MSGAEFNRKHKLAKPSDFKRVFKKPYVSTDACFKVLARAGEADTSRLGMAVSKQVDKKAVGRNRIKRVVRESFRLHFANTAMPLDIIILPRRETSTMCNRMLFTSLESHWCRLDSRFEG